MTNPETEPQFNRDEFTKIFDEYRARIEQITRQTEINLQSIRTSPDTETDAEAEPEPVSAETETETPAADQLSDETAEEPAEAAIDETPGPEEEPEEAPQQAPVYEQSPAPVMPEREIRIPESAAIVREAEKKAKKILEEAEERAKKDARKKVKSQVEKLLEKARQDAEEMITQAQNIISKERGEAIAASKAQTEQLLREITEEYRRETQSRSAEAVSGAREKAENVMAEVMGASQEVNTLIKKSLERAHIAVTEFEAKLQEETHAISQSIEDIQIRIEQLMAAAKEPEYEPVPAGPADGDADQIPASLPTLKIHVLGDRSNGKNGTQPLFFGKVEMKSESATSEYQHFKNLKKQFVRIPSIKQLQESASEKEMSALFDITEPLPLLEILSKMPSVSEVVSDTDRDISIVFQKNG